MNQHKLPLNFSLETLLQAPDCNIGNKKFQIYKMSLIYKR